ncbi:Alpha/Beta hydrolase protein [Yarrowia lipolytica]|uniref:triacylglycerol lipase n=2 Tax=Yarrowia lipolytica TaxID=4952 RepID=Q6C687_YARLI|nr:YALI0E11561p [Yarrowia lipolytica CLIB122]RDW49267.1 Alpha/Beta hydrolase protein [Yarrowia lipolytica]RDW55854.1 Alpha/Beta hydrolase protein [Yarrowia lipolytica]CAG79418.1 YALI0E11561p [Yarrowia lipolytica CLIB122]|eukprot:XP_503825.1 YALI0E11561p [Yarrowia lipolytica CLIB122]
MTFTIGIMNLTLGQVVAYLYASLFGEPPATLSKTRVQASQELYNFTAKFSRIANIAYCVNAPVTPLRTDFTCGESCRYFPNMTLDSVFGGDFYSTSITGYIAYDHLNKEKYVVIRGTFSIPDAVTDIQFQQSPWLVELPKHLIPTQDDMKQRWAVRPDLEVENKGLDNLKERALVVEDPRLIPIKTSECKGCMIHDGFAKAFNETMVNAAPQFEKFLTNHTDYKMYVTGHSLGAAQALLFATHFKLLGHDPTMINFGQPRVGNSEFANYINQLWFNDTGLEVNDKRRNYRLTHWNDIFVGLPDWSNYTHAIGEVYIDQESVYPALDKVSVCEGGENEACHRGTFNLWSRIDLLQNHLAYIYYIGYCALNIGRRNVLAMPKYHGNNSYKYATEPGYTGPGRTLVPTN